MKRIISSLFTVFTVLTLHSQSNFTYHSPLDIPISLSANFGELRANHFHSGIDLRTQSVVNKNVYSIEEGYISRIGINAGGYGLVLYIDHPNGQTSVYAHLNSFSPKIAKYVKEEQYKRERYAINIDNIAPEALPIKRGEFIAKSGNTGSSGGPHVHFEIRDTKSEFTLDPLPYFIDEIKDNVSPEIRGLAVYPQEGFGVVNNKSTPYRESIKRLKDNSHSLPKNRIEAWGTIGIGIYALDRMSNTTFIYGIKKVDLFCDNVHVFSSDINSLDFATSRMINSFTDFDYWRKNKRFYMKSFIEPGNTLHILDKSKNGYININEERPYTIRYALEDVHGNVTSYSFIIEGKQQEIPIEEPCSLVMKWDEDNRYISSDFHLHITPKMLYKDINFVLTRNDSNNYFSKIYTVHNKSEPLDKYVDMSLQLTIDTLANKNQYGVIAVDKKGKESWVGGIYNNGFISTRIRELGQTYTISIDTIVPEITPIAEEDWTKNKKITIRVKDDFSGIESFRGTINGEFVLFEHDIKSTIYTYHFDPERLKKGKHLLEFSVVDNAGNKSIYQTYFVY